MKKFAFSRISGLIAAIVCSAVVWMGCGTDPQKTLLGQWATENAADSRRLEFFNDGTGLAEGTASGQKFAERFTWNMSSDGRLIITLMGTTGAFTIVKISKSELVLTNPDGETETYARGSAKQGGQSAKSDKPQKATSFTDSRDGKNYRTVKIGGQTWMAQNLNFASPAKGSSWCYNNDASNCEMYGRLYDWNAAMSACPPGWRLPTIENWSLLVTATGGKAELDTEGKLKSKTNWESEHGDDRSGNGTDDFGFSALPGGARGYESGNAAFEFLNNRGFWWTTTNDDGYVSYALFGGGDYATDDFDYEHSTSVLNAGFSVRCVRGEVGKLSKEESENFAKAEAMKRVEEAMRVIWSLEMMPSAAIPESQWWQYTVTHGTITATLKIKLLDVEAGAKLISVHNAKRNCFSYTIAPGLAPLMPSVFIQNECR